MRSPANLGRRPAQSPADRVRRQAQSPADRARRQAQSPANRVSKAKEAALLGIFLSCALVLGLIERMIPVSFGIPGMRLGLPNVAVLLALYLFPPSRALILTVLKCLLAALFSGSPSALFYSLGGSLLSFVVMLALILLFRELVSPLGVSVAGAAFHNIGQILVACLLFQSWTVLVYLPLLLLVGIGAGAAVGVLVLRLRPYLESYLNVKKE